MTWKRNCLKNTVTKLIGASTALTIGGTVTHSSTPFDLGLDKKYSGAKIIYYGAHTGTIALDVQMTVNTGPTNALATGAATTITAKGTAVNTGHAGSGGTVILESYVDFADQHIDRWIGVDILATAGSGTDGLTGIILMVLEAAREEPTSTLGTNTMTTA
jgi:hypothetical protein